MKLLQYFRLQKTLKILEQTLRTKILKVLQWQQLLPDTPQNLISSRSSWGKHRLKIWKNPCKGLECGTSTSFKPPTATRTAQGMTITPAFMGWG